MDLKLKKAIDLYNARMSDRNEKAGRKEGYNLVSATHVMMRVKPEASYETCSVAATRLLQGKAKSFRYEWVNPICSMLGVDPNFLFGFPSKFDREFERLMNKQ